MKNTPEVRISDTSAMCHDIGWAPNKSAFDILYMVLNTWKEYTNTCYSVQVESFVEHNLITFVTLNRMHRLTTNAIMASWVHHEIYPYIWQIKTQPVQTSPQMQSLVITFGCAVYAGMRIRYKALKSTLILLQGWKLKQWKLKCSGDIAYW